MKTNNKNLNYLGYINYLTFFLSTLIFITFTSCNKEDCDCDSTIDYSDTYNWASIPTPVKSVDVFYAYPTVYWDSIPPNMDITDENNRQDVIDKMNSQMGLYSPYCNIFVPYYRQMYRDGFNDLPVDEATELLNKAYGDVVDAFEYYMQNLNNGRPFILVGHSQGSGILADMLRNEFDNSDYTDLFVAAYLTGVSMFPSDTVDYPWIKLAKTENDIGVVITYNTLDYQHYESSSFQTGALCVNPLIWSVDTTYASQDQNLGAVWTDENGNITQEIYHFTDAYIRYDGALAVTMPNPDDYYDPERQPYGAYHDYDQIFFYRNLQQNVNDRIEAYYSK